MILRLVDRASGPIRDLQGRLRGLGRAVRDLDSQRLIDIADNRREALRGQAIEAAALGAALYGSLRPAIRFESAMADVGKVVGFEAADGLARMGDAILDLSKHTPMAAGGIAEIVAAAGQAGIVDQALPDAEKRAALIDFARDAARMGVAFDIAAGQAGSAMTGLRNIFRLTQPEVVGLADAVNHLSNNMASSAPELLDFLNRAGGQAEAIGLTGQQAAALGSTLIALKIPAEEAGTAVNAMLTRLAAAEEMPKEFQEALDKIGLSSKALAEALNTDAQGALNDLFGRIRAQGPEATAILFRLFGQEHVGKLQKVVGSLDKYIEAQRLVADETAYAGSMLREYETRAATTENNLQLLQNRLSEIAIVMGTTVLPALKDLLDDLAPVIEAVSKWVRENPELVEGIIQVTAGLVALKIAGVVFGWLIWSWVAGLGRLIQTFQILGPIILWIGRLFLANPIGLAVTAIAAAVYLIYRNWQPIKAWFGRLWDQARRFFEGFAEFLSGVWSGDLGRIATGVKVMWDAVGAYFAELWEGIKWTFRAAAALLGFETEFQAAVDAISAIWSGLSDFFAGLWDDIKAIFQAAWSAIKPIVDGLTAAARLDFSNLPGGSAAGRALLSVVPGGAAVSGALDLAGKRAAGGPVRRGLTYLVGERGAELFQPDQDGRIVPNHRLTFDQRPPVAAGRSGAGRTVQTGPISIAVHAGPGMDARQLADEVARQLRAALDAAAGLHDGALIAGQRGGA